MVQYQLSSPNHQFRLLVHVAQSVVHNVTISLDQSDLTGIELVQPSSIQACSNLTVARSLVTHGFSLIIPSSLSIDVSDVSVIGRDNTIMPTDWYYWRNGEVIYFYPLVAHAGTYLIDVYVYNTLLNQDLTRMNIVASTVESAKYSVWGVGGVGGRVGDILYLYISKQDIYGNAL